MKRCFLVISVLVLSVSVQGIFAQKKYDSYRGLVMAGYQGWFNTPDDGADRGWYHYKGKNGFKPGSASVDFWPDVSEYPKTYKTEFKFKDGSPAYTFSSNDASTVDVHFRWMQEYGLDGVFMQRFVSEIRRPSSKAHFNKVLNSAMNASTKYERAICVMYDLSGMRPGYENTVLSDIDEIEKTYEMKGREKVPGYLYQNGKPLVVIWGVGFNDKRAYGLKECETILDGLKNRGYSVMLGVPTHWRELNSDTTPNEDLHRLIKKSDVIMPWFVGRYDEQSYGRFKSLIKKDIRWCEKNKIEYAPLCFPGFSWRNMKGPNTRQIDRNGGSFFWMQLSSVLEYGAKMIYVAMFDEIDEGTAIFKCANKSKVPLNGNMKFEGIDDNLPSDYYLWMVGEAGQILRKEQSLTQSIPRRN
ncbi:glycoside hydrolase family 71/99-like protein [Viscerimonas tarda]